MMSVGERPGKGNYCCTNCSWRVQLNDDDSRLPPCENCDRKENATFVRC